MEWNSHEMLSIKKNGAADFAVNNCFTHGSKVEENRLSRLSRISRANPLATGVTTYLLSGMNHQVYLGRGEYGFWMLLAEYMGILPSGYQNCHAMVRT